MYLLKHLHRPALQAGVLAGLALAAYPSFADPVSVGGTGSGMGVAKRLAEAYQTRYSGSEIRFVMALGSSGGIKATAAGMVDIGLSGRPLKPSERHSSLVEQELARTPLVAASMRAHSGFTLEEVARIYAGTLTTWPDGSTLRPVLRPESDSESALLRAMSPAIARGLVAAHARPGLHVAITDQDSADAIERIPGAFGTSTLALIVSERRPLRVLPLNGVVPSVDALARGRYPYYKPLYLVMRADSSAPARAFAAFVASEEGERILSDNGYLPSTVPGK